MTKLINFIQVGTNKVIKWLKNYELFLLSVKKYQLVQTAHRVQKALQRTPMSSWLNIISLVAHVLCTINSEPKLLGNII